MARLSLDQRLPLKNSIPLESPAIKKFPYRSENSNASHPWTVGPVFPVWANFLLQIISQMASSPVAIFLFHLIPSLQLEPVEEDVAEVVDQRTVQDEFVLVILMMIAITTAMIPVIRQKLRMNRMEKDCRSNLLSANQSMNQNPTF
jgi:hypothetical protein